MRKLRSSVIPAVTCILVLSTVLMAVLTRGFFQPDNLRHLLFELCLNLLVAAGIMMISVGGYVDFSSAGQTSLICVLLLEMTENGMSIWLAVLVCILIGGLCGMLNGLVISIPGVQSFAATLALLAVYYGLSRAILELVPLKTAAISFFGGNETIFILVCAAAAVTGMISAAVFMEKTYPGRYIKAVGFKPDVLKRAGISTGMIQILCFSACAVLVAVQAVFRTGSAFAYSPVTDVSMVLEIMGISCLSYWPGFNLRYYGMKNEIRLISVTISAVIFSTVKCCGEIWEIGASVKLCLLGVVSLAAVIMDQRRDQTRQIEERIRASGAHGK